MARRRTSTFDDLVIILSRLPWWVSLGIGEVFRGQGYSVTETGGSAGNAFWGCSKYPGCRGVVNV